MLHFKNQVSPPCMEVDLKLCFHWRVSSRSQYIDTLSWFNVVFAYRYHGSGLRTQGRHQPWVQWGTAPPFEIGAHPKPNYYFWAHLQCSLKFVCKFIPWYLH